MARRLRYSVYTLPWLLDFHQKIASLPVIEGSGTGQVGLFTTAGSPGVDVNLERFTRTSDVISDVEGSLMRVFDGPDIIDEWIIKRGSRQITEAKVLDLSGDALPSIFDKYLVPSFDGGDNPATQPNWIWGGENILTNPGFEDNAVTPTLYELTITATGGTYTLSDGTNTTSAIAFNAIAATIEDELQNDIAAINDVSVAGAGTSPLTWQILFNDPATGITLTVNTGSLTGGTATLTPVNEGSAYPTGWFKAQAVIGGQTTDTGNYDFWGVTTEQADEGTHSLKIDPGVLGATSNRDGGAQQVVSVTPGLYQMSIRNRPTSGSDLYRLGLFGIGGEQIAWNGYAGQTLSTGTFNTISVANVIVPEGTTQVIYRAQCTNLYPSNPSAFYLDTAVLAPGLPPSTPGDILTLLFDAHTEIPNWIDYSSFDATTDSNGDAWPEDISFEVQWGEHYGHVLDRMVDLGYEWEWVPKATPSGTLTHDFHLYASGGRDATYVNGGIPTTAINKGQGVLSGDVVKRIPDYTSVLLEGAGQEWSLAADTTAQTNFGVLEKFVANRQLLNETTRVLAAEQYLAYEEANRSAVRVEVAGTSSNPRPLVDYRPGDSIPFQIPPGLPKETRRVQRIDYTNTYPPKYVVTGSRVLGGEAAAYDLIWRLWRRFTRPVEPAPAVTPIITSGGGEFTVSIAAADATVEELAKADFFCLGANDQNVINEAWKRLDQISGGAGGRLVFSSGHFHITVATAGIAYNPTAGAHGFEFVGVGSQGAGQSTTFVLDAASGSNQRMLDSSNSDSVTVRNITFNGNGKGASCAGLLNFFSGGQTVIDCTFYSLLYGVFSDYASDQGTRVLNSWFDGCAMAIRATAGAHIIGNHIEDCSGTASDQGGINAGGGTGGNGPWGIIANNTIINGANYGIISGGLVDCYSNHMHNNADSGILITGQGGAYRGNVINNSGFHGIETPLSNTTGGALIVGNRIISPQRHGMFIDMPDFRIYDNKIEEAGQATSNTYDGIHISHNAARVMRNTIRSTSSRSRYGVRIDTGTGSIVVANDFGAAAGYGTNAYSDAGTSTVNTFAGSFGDNFST